MDLNTHITQLLYFFSYVMANTKGATPKRNKTPLQFLVWQRDQGYVRHEHSRKLVERDKWAFYIISLDFFFNLELSQNKKFLFFPLKPSFQLPVRIPYIVKGQF